MSCHVKHVLSDNVWEIARDEQLEKVHKKHRPSFCLRCKKALVKEIVIDAETIGISDPEVLSVVTYIVQCEELGKPHIFDKMSRPCYRGTTCAERRRCKSCAHSIAKVVPVTKYSPQERKHCSPIRQFKTVYGCTNLNRMQQFNKDHLYMSSCITCEWYKEKES